MKEIEDIWKGRENLSREINNRIMKEREKILKAFIFLLTFTNKRLSM